MCTLPPVKRVILFLDFDGVIHHFFPLPVEDDKENAYFYYLPVLENVIREFLPLLDIKIVISSSWRKLHSLEKLREPFSEDIRPLVVSSTPVIGTYSRFEEISQWLDNNNYHDEWFALDDTSSIFSDTSRLIVCDNKFAERERKLLTDRLASLI
jgi:hypothetical protein